MGREIVRERKRERDSVREKEREKALCVRKCKSRVYNRNRWYVYAGAF